MRLAMGCHLHGSVGLGKINSHDSSHPRSEKRHPTSESPSAARGQTTVAVEFDFVNRKVRTPFTEGHTRIVLVMSAPMSSMCAFTDCRSRLAVNLLFLLQTTSDFFCMEVEALRKDMMSSLRLCHM